MAKYLTTVPNGHTTDTDFRTWGNSLDSAIVSFNWVRTSDTGQINWATVLKPSAISTMQGYSIFRMDDSLQGTNPVFLKIEYGSSASGAAMAAIAITVGTGSDGDGVITGVLFARQILEINATYNTTYTSVGSGASNRLALILWATSSVVQSTIGFGIERTHNSSGVDTAEGLLIFWLAKSLTGSKYIPYSGTVPPSYSRWNSALPATLSAGNAVSLSAVRCWTPGNSCPSENFSVYSSLDFPSYQAISSTMYSGVENITWYTIPLLSTSHYFGFAYSITDTYATIAVRYD